MAEFPRAAKPGPTEVRRSEPPPGGEPALHRRWAGGVAGWLRVADGRALRVIFPGVKGPGAGPDFRDAVLDLGGDLLRGDIELHLRETGWRRHRHDRDLRYRSVVLHVVSDNDGGVVATRSGRGRSIPLLVLGTRQGAFEQFQPPCSRAPAALVEATLAVLGRERLAAKVGTLAPLVEARGAGPVLYAAILEVMGGPLNRAAFHDLGRRIPLGALLERIPAGPAAARRRAAAAELRWAAGSLVLRWAGQRPMASPGRRLEVAAGLVAQLWEGAGTHFPARLAAAPARLPRVEGLGLALQREILVNAVIPALAHAGVSAGAVVDAWEAVRSPGTYGHLRWLERHLSRGGRSPFGTAARLQGGLRLHREYCAKGMCGRCPLSSAAPSTARR